MPTEIHSEADLEVLIRDNPTVAAVFTAGSEEIFLADIEQCVGGSPYLEGYVFWDGETVQGYGMVAKSFSTEFGKPCIWIEDLFLKSNCRGKGIGQQFLAFVEAKYPHAILRLEVEAENQAAVHVYQKRGFSFFLGRSYSARTSAIFLPMASPRMPRATILPSGPKRIISGIP